jgi:hypothetical protein
MIQLSLVRLLLPGVHWSDDLTQVATMFLSAGLIFFVLFSAQLFLICKIEKWSVKRCRGPTSADHT